MCVEEWARMGASVGGKAAGLPHVWGHGPTTEGDVADGGGGKGPTGCRIAGSQEHSPPRGGQPGGKEPNPDPQRMVGIRSKARAKA